MAKGAAKESDLGALHSALARVLKMSLDRYLKIMSAIEDLDGATPEDVVSALVEYQEPSPALLTAVAKFLKDNEIMLDSTEVDHLSSTARRLQERREERKRRGFSLDDIPLVDSAVQ